MNYQQNITRIRAVYNTLKDLTTEVVFVGGATVSLYADRETTDVRPTDDVDVLVEIYTRNEYQQVEEALRAAGFAHDRESGILCRFVVQGITVDVMPIDASVLGFTNRWYAEGYQEAVDLQMDELYRVRIFSAPYFIASKLEAFKGRGEGDGRTSHDFEDVVYVLNNRSTVWEEMEGAPETVRQYLKDEVAELLANPYLSEWIGANLDYSEQGRENFIVEQMQVFISADPKF